MTTPTIDQKTYDSYLKRLWRVTSNDKKIAAGFCCSNLETGIVLWFHETPSQPYALMSQECFETIRKMYIL